MQNLKFLQELWRQGAEVYEVGGSVRDQLLGLPVKDQDLLVRKLPFPALKNSLAPFGKVALVGKSFGVIKFNPHENPEKNFDIALPRTETSTGVGHRDFEVLYDPNLDVTTDLGRRDFTINAMAINRKDGLLIDPFGGKEDLRLRLLKQVFPNAFEEDPLRMIRAVQFAARFGLKIEEKTWAAMKEKAALIQTVSPERIMEEFRKLFLAEKPSHGFGLMLDSGLMSVLLPEISILKGIGQDKLPGDDVYLHTMRVVDAARSDALIENRNDLELLLAALFHDCGKPATKAFDAEKNRISFYGHQLVSTRLVRKWMKKMRVETVGINPKNVETLVFHHMFETKSYFTEKAIRRFVRKISPELIFKLLDLRLADNRGGKHPNSFKGVQNMRERIRTELAKQPPFGPRDLAITGHDLMNLGIPASPLMGEIIKQLVDVVVDDPSLNTKEHLLALVPKIRETLATEEGMQKEKKRVAVQKKES